MSHFLALDTSSNACSVALSIDNKVYHRFELTPRGHMQRLLPMVNEVLEEAKVKLTTLDAIVFGCGPGSFTGLRVATGVVQGLAFGADLSVMGVSSLAVLAQGFLRMNPSFNGHLGVAIDARMNEVYAARFNLQGQCIEAVGDERVIEPSLALTELFLDIDAACGSGWQIDALSNAAPTHVVIDIEPDAMDLLTLALSGQYSTACADQARPVYLRDSITWQKRRRIRSEAL